ncbi:glutaredoxin-related protein [Phocaeicola fibrisolvens]|uniref:glutaredoxin-related protein n=1 Tax=Phocaeicola fibrisolvens TaxID=2981793 RepID=UPI00082245CA|nr:glutaredoxin-related protein [Phocaeicola fibrisolvens]MCU6779133.1 glutaredoxin-related protein [Phocaeicola fibrisolvens]SCI22332.1 Glutaredoxin-related protein [uncultured Bacteroides sp.]
MIKIYGMDTCPDCTYVEAQVKGNDRYEIIDIGQHVKNLKAFLKLRDHSPAFDEAKHIGAAGIPCFVLEDGTVTLCPEDAGLHSRPIEEGATCNLDGSGC